MVRVLGRRVVVLVAVDAVIPHALEREQIVGLVAIHTAQVAVRAYQGEPVLFVQFGNGIDQPSVRGVASGAIIPNRHGMHVGVARNAFRCGPGLENERRVAGLAIHGLVLTFQGKRGAVMVLSLIHI